MNIKLLLFTLKGQLLSTMGSVSSTIIHLRIFHKCHRGSSGTPDTIEYMEVLNAMKGQGALTVTQLLDKMPDPDKLTNQKLSALLRVLAEANIIEQTEVKRRSFWEYK